MMDAQRSSGTEAIQSLALTLQGVHHIHGCHRLAVGVLSVGHRVIDHVLQERSQSSASLLVHQPRDTPHATAASQTADRRLGDYERIAKKPQT